MQNVSYTWWAVDNLFDLVKDVLLHNNTNDIICKRLKRKIFSYCNVALWL